MALSLDRSPVPPVEGDGDVPSQSLWQIATRQRLDLLVGLFIGICAAFFYVEFCPRIYQAEAQILVEKKRPEDFPGISIPVATTEENVTAQRSLLQSYTIARKALERIGTSSFRSYPDADGDLKNLLAAFKVRAVSSGMIGKGDAVFDLSFRGKYPDECAEYLRAVIDSYQDSLMESHRANGVATLKEIARQRDEIIKDIEKKVEAHRKFREKTPLLWEGKEEVSKLRQERLSNIESKRSTLLLREIELKNHLSAMETALKEGQKRDVLQAMILEWSSKANTVNEYWGPNQRITPKDQLIPLLEEEAKLLARYGPDHPKVQALRKRMDTALDFLTRSPAAWSRADLEPAGKPPSPALDRVALHMRQIKDEIRNSQDSVRVLGELYDRELAKITEQSSFEVIDDNYRKDLDRSRMMLEAISQRYRDVDLMKDLGSYRLRELSPPNVVRQVVPDAKLAFPIGAALGLLAGFGVAVYRTKNDRQPNTPESVARLLGRPVLAQIPYFTSMTPVTQLAPPSRTTLAPMVCAHYRPQSIETESYRRLRTVLFYGADKQYRVLLITSALAKQGKTTLAANLAVLLAQTGKKTVLVDANMRNPAVHKMFGASLEPGLASILDREAILEASLQECGIRNLRLLTAGRPPLNPGELLSTPAFDETLARLQSSHDYVLIDSPSLLEVADSSVIAVRADGVLLTIQSSRDDQLLLERCRETLESVHATFLGVVVNGRNDLAPVRSPVLPRLPVWSQLQPFRSLSRASRRSMDKVLSSLTSQLGIQALIDNERRKQPRSAFSEQVSVIEQPGGDPMPVIARDLSKGGIGFVSALPLSQRDLVMSLTLDDGKQVKMRVRVVRCEKLIDGSYLVGAQFLQIET